MNIYAKKGTKLVFSHPDWGYEGHQRKAAQYLIVGHEYTVDHTEVDSFHTDVYLQEVPNEAFNSVHFDEAAQ